MYAKIEHAACASEHPMMNSPTVRTPSLSIDAECWDTDSTTISKEEELGWLLHVKKIHCEHSDFHQHANSLECESLKSQC